MSGGGWQVNDGELAWVSPAGDGVELEQLTDYKTPPALKIPAHAALVADVELARRVTDPSDDLVVRLAMGLAEATAPEWDLVLDAGDRNYYLAGARAALAALADTGDEPT